MLASEGADPQLRRAVRSTDEAWLSQIERWTDDRPDPALWLDTLDLQRARREVQEALRERSRPIVVSGPSGYGKTLLLRSLRSHPPPGFAAPLYVPFANVEPGALAGWIWEAGNRRPVRDPEAALVRLLRSNRSRGSRTLVLVDEVQAMPCATLSELFEIVTRPGAEASVILAGLAGESLDLTLGALLQPLYEIPVAAPWSRADAEALLTRVAVSLRVPPSDVIAAVDVDAALAAGAGNPRLVRAALAVRLRRAARSRASTVPAAASTIPQPAVTAGSCPSVARLLPDVSLPARSSELPTPARTRPPWSGNRVERAIGAATSRLRSNFARCLLRAASQADRAARGARALPRLAARSLRVHGRWLADAARHRASAASAGARARSLTRGAAARRAARRWAYELETIAITAWLVSSPGLQRGLRAAASRLEWSIAGGISRLQRGTLWCLLRAASQVDGAARGARALLLLAARLRLHVRWLADAARHRARAMSAGARARSLPRGAAARRAARRWAHELEALAITACLVPYPQFRRGLKAVGKGLLAATRFRMHAALALPGAIAALAMVAGGDWSTTPTTASEPPVQGSTGIGGAGAERIPFRVNSQPWSSVEIDGVDAGSTPFTVALEPGPHHFRVAMADGRIIDSMIVVSAQQERAAFR